jgi:hypothetical protein
MQKMILVETSMNRGRGIKERGERGKLKCDTVDTL